MIDDSMTAILVSLYLGHRPGEDPVSRKDLSTMVDFVSSLSDPEKAFVQANRAQLGSGRARHFADLVHAYWRLFRSLPIVIQLLLLITLVMSVIVSPYVGQVMIEAMKAPNHPGMRMIVSCVSSGVLSITILLVLLLL